MFIARISRGRTIREFVIGVLLIPSGVTFVWFTIMGGTALIPSWSGAGGLVEAVNDQGAAISLFALLDQYPCRGLHLLRRHLPRRDLLRLGRRCRLGGDGDALQRGTINPPAGVVVLWGVLAGASAAVLLVMGGLRAPADRVDHRRGAVPAGHGRSLHSLWKALQADRPVPGAGVREEDVEPEPDPARVPAGQAGVPTPG